MGGSPREQALPLVKKLEGFSKDGILGLQVGLTHEDGASSWFQSDAEKFFLTHSLFMLEPVL